MPELLYNRCCRSCKFSCTQIRCALFLFAFRNAPSGLVNTMPAAVSVYDRMKSRNTGFSTDNFIFLPAYKNRSTAKQIIQRQFNALLERCRLKEDRWLNSVHTVYSLRHTAICMRIILSGGKVNIFNLAKNAGTSVDQIERFYARNPPLSREMAINLQSFGSG
jgi:hypothetical protein